MENIDIVTRIEELPVNGALQIKDRLTQGIERLIIREHGYFRLEENYSVIFFTACKMGLFNRLNLFWNHDEIARINVINWKVVE